MYKVLKIKAIVIIAFLCVISNTSYAQSNSPNTPEAASFEPVDATDMVNLVTGDLTYVLPLLNVPSPEGGYPIALSYHAGVAMDQEASWVGLGWNLNPGAINRSVNGYPDEYNSSFLSEYFYDEGGQEEIYSLSIGYSAGVSVGVSLSWGSNRSLGGSVSIGYGVDVGTTKVGGSVSIGTDGASIGLGASFANGLSLGVNASTNGTFGGSVGFNNNGVGFSVGASSSGNYTASITSATGNGNSVSLDFTFSSSGVGISGNVRNRNKAGKTVGGAGVGLSVSFNNAVNMGDYTVKSSGWSIPIVVPTPIGIFSLGFGKQKIRYYLGKNELNNVSGPMYFYDDPQDVTFNRYKWRNNCTSTIQSENRQIFGDEFPQPGAPITRENGDPYFSSSYLGYNNGVHTYICYWHQYSYVYTSSNVPPSSCHTLAETIFVNTSTAFMDMYEVPIDNNTIAEQTDVTINNLAFPSYDKYNVQAQGLSGSISPVLFDNGALFGLSEKQSKDEDDVKYELDYKINGSTTIPDFAKFSQKPYFYMDNEISTHLNYTDVGTANFNTSTTNASIIDYYVPNSVELNAKPRRKTSNYIEYFTNAEIQDNYATVKSKGFLRPIADGNSFDRGTKPRDGIGAFKITAADGKTYHYSLPVYNHETITRSFGAIKHGNGNPKDEKDSYFEKRQLEPYATHWLLTAVTGPDYIDKNNDGIANEGDYGYWTNFSYGKWSDAWVWKAPHKKDYFLSNDDAGIKTWVRGRKELFYLNSIKTRTHTALFVKSGGGRYHSGWSYKSVKHRDNYDQNSSSYVERFNIPSQLKLKLDKILLFRNVDANTVTATSANDADSDTVFIEYNDSDKPGEVAEYNAVKNVITAADIPTALNDKALKSISFAQSLFEPGAGTRRTLRWVTFSGKGGVSSLPRYKFDYHRNPSGFNINDKDQWGYHKNGNQYWSLKQITTPQGGRIVIDYETHQSMSPINHEFLFTNYTQGIYTSTYPTYTSITDVSNKVIEISSGTPLALNVGDKVSVKYNSKYPPLNGQGVFGSYNGLGTITTDLGNSKYEVALDNDINLWYEGTATNIPLIESYLNSSDPDRRSWAEKFYRSTEVSFDTEGKVIDGGGVRVSKIRVIDGPNTYSTHYKYGENENGVGYVSYLPYSQELEKEVPYSAELPAPKVMYEYVTTKASGTDGVVQGKMIYKFNVLKEKSANQIKFGDFYEITTDSENEFVNSVANKRVNVSKFTVKDNLAAIGQLLEVTSYNVEDQILNKTTNEYYAQGETPNSYGITQEAYQTYKEVDFNSSSIQDRWIVNSSKRIKYPSLLKTTTSISNSYVDESTFTQFNPTTGQSDEIITVDSKNRRFKTEYTPAYTIPQYSSNLSGFGMGSKLDNISNKNMLSQEAMNKTYIEVGSNWEEINVGITTWNNSWIYPKMNDAVETSIPQNERIWRKHKTYAWDGAINADGTYQSFSGNDDNFNWNLGATQSNQKWLATSTITKYNHFSSPLEVEDLNGNYVISKMCDNDSKVAFSANSKYYESFYTGAEYYDTSTSRLDAQIRGNSGLRSTDKAHTGKYSLKITPSDNSFGAVLKGNSHRAGKYKMSIWVHIDNHTNARFKQTYSGTMVPFNGEKVYAGEWVQLNHYFDRTEAQTTGDRIFMVASASGTIYVDDYRLHPVETSMTSYVYNDSEELSYILGSNNLGTHFIYDSLGRLEKTYTEIVDDSDNNIVGGFKLSTKNHYNYKY
ncbi:hypothetical protein [Psychroserpens luteolus]|uniref:hypothetical protein n=1 Tax=Psychroserpens luteolus TaxID=2855840 RepID=UPI001E41D2EC|nr:hypothetical protein [Psychroserpens luteolus]MCD2257579.1 hypothetical protein [Psychroserpens luteolus]